MARVIRQPYTVPVPEGAALVTKNGKRYARIQRGGEWVLAPLTAKNPGRCTLLSEHWYVELRVPGQERPDRVKGYKDKRATEALARQLEATAERRAAGMPVADPEAGKRLLTKLCDDYLAELTRLGKSEDHLRGIESALRLGRDWCGWRFVADVRAEKFREWLAELQADGKAPRTQNQYLGLWQTFLSWCVAHGVMEANPLKVIRKARDVREERASQRRPLKPDQLARLLEASPPKRRIVYGVAAWTGFRRRTLRLLERGMLDLTDPARPLWRLPARVLKNRRPTVLPVSPNALEWLRQRALDAMAPTDRLLPTPPIMRTFRQDLKRANLDPAAYVFHSLRYTFCATMGRLLPIQKVKVLMCHRTLAMTADLYLSLGIDDVAEDVWTLPAL